MAMVFHGYRGARLYTALFCSPVSVGLRVCVIVVGLGAVMAAMLVVVSSASLTLVGLISLVTEGASVVGMIGEEGDLCDVSCTVEVGGSASQLCVGGSLVDVVVGIVVG